jgi:hypothetical protein
VSVLLTELFGRFFILFFSEICLTLCGTDLIGS